MNKAAVILALGQICTLALAQATRPSHTGAARGAVPVVVCGPTAQDQQQAVQAQARRHELMLAFAFQSGASPADVEIEIRNNQHGVVLDTKCGAPSMLVDLPDAGKWRVTAEANGLVQQKTIPIRPAQVAQATFVWPASTS